MREDEERTARVVRRELDLFKIVFNVLSFGIPLLALIIGVGVAYSKDYPNVKILCAVLSIILILVCLYFMFPKPTWICSSCKGALKRPNPNKFGSCPYCRAELKYPRAYFFG
ncbi:MAG: hypothetical protein ACYTHN_21605, partial [Planctomycetota bacterium]